MLLHKFCTTKLTMETREIKKTIYVAFDGREFLEKKDCQQYEENIQTMKTNVRCFSVRYNPDLTETGLFNSKMYIMVYSQHFCFESIVENFLTHELKIPIIGPGVQGYGFTNYYNIAGIETDTFIELLKNESNIIHILCSSKELEKIAKTCDIETNNIRTFDYVREWGFK